MRYSFIALPAAMLLATSALANEPFSKQGWEKAYALRQIKLGMTLADFRAVDLGKKNGEGLPIKDVIVCDRDELATVTLAFASVSEAGMRDVGVTKCEFFYGSGISRDSFYPTDMGFGERYPGEYRAEYRTGFYFIKPQGAPHAYLFRMQGDLDPELYSQVRNGVSQKYGSPRVRRQAVQNGFGALFQNETATWNNSTSRITIEKYYLDLERGKIVYELKPLQAIYEKRKATVSSEPARTTSY